MIHVFDEFLIVYSIEIVHSTYIVIVFNTVIRSVALSPSQLKKA